MFPATLQFRFRPDLVCERVFFGSLPSWVIRDPVAGRLFHLSEREYSILGALDGSRDLQQLLDDVRRRHPDEYVSPDALIRFLSQARESGLIAARGGDAPVAPPRQPAQQSFRLFSAQVPLASPEAFLRTITPDLSFVFTRGFAAVYAALVCSAALSIVVRFEDFTDRLPAASAWFTPAMAAVVAIVLFSCKVVHELAHGVTATRFGARVEECGVLFLFFVPCFYCDVSEAWLFRSRAKRILVSAAGMLAELGLASVAAWLWWFSQPGPVRTVCLTVMMTCSVNTLLINGNPLMRFDGYFLLVDALGLPNLAARAGQWWSAFWSRCVWGLPGSAGDDRDWRCGLYGALSWVYRLAIVAGLLWFVHRAGREWGLAPLTIALAVVTVGGIVVRSARTVGRPLGDSLLRRMMRPGRVITALTAGAVLLSFATLLPFPRSVEAYFVLEPAEATRVFATAPGRLISLTPAGTRLADGEPIATLENLSLQGELVEAETEEQVTARRLESVRLRRNVDPKAGEEIPSLTEALAAVKERKRLLQRDVEGLTIRAGAAGRLLPPPNVVDRTADPRQPEFWTGTPFDPRNEHCYLERGTLVGVITANEELHAVAYVGMRDVERLRTGQHVRLAVEGGGERPMTGTVTEISPSPVEHLARELAATRKIAVRPGDSQPDVPLEPHYQVRITLVGRGRDFVTGSAGLARIEVAKASLLRRLLDAVQDAFQFDAGSTSSTL